MAKFSAILITLAAVLTGSVYAQEEEDSFPSIDRKYYVGVRLGGWVNAGEDIPQFAVDTVADAVLETDIKDGSFYFEAYGAYAVLPQAYLELSVGVVNRGTVSVFQGPFSDIGNLVLYPMLLQLKFYPFAPIRSRFQPFVAVGGGVYYGRQDVQFTNDLFFTNLNEDSETDINYTLAAGADWLLNDFLALELHGRYMPINFSQPLITARDYDAVSVSVGVKYLLGEK
ncbi:MAG: outer membrane beta-barrel protein [Candidatus Zixiibacteriota bacterium]|nr:MAG: outer membrane beta-barrel protein [candidate division Zixibacteria bacterium]